MSEPNNRLPAKREPSLPPAPLWRQAAPAVIRGAALVAAGVVGQWALRNAARQAVTMPFRAAKSKPKAVARRSEPQQDVVAISETVVMRRRVIVRR